MMTRTISLGIASVIWLMALVTPLSAQGPTNNAVKVVWIRVWLGGQVDVEFSGNICDLDGLVQNWDHLVPSVNPPGVDPGTTTNDVVKEFLSILLAAKLSSRDVVVGTFTHAFDGDLGCRLGSVTLR
jgi:hypothetical protein